MFTESLQHGDEAQREIQKLMDFFEREHELGIIPLDLEQKVIRKYSLLLHFISFMNICYCRCTIASFV